jgi:hypothetical protein
VGRGHGGCGGEGGRGVDVWVSCIVTLALWGRLNALEAFSFAGLQGFGAVKVHGS